MELNEGLRFRTECKIGKDDVTTAVEEEGSELEIDALTTSELVNVFDNQGIS